MITYSYRVDSLRTETAVPLADAIIEVEWSILGVNEAGLTGQQPRKTSFSLAEVDPENFVPFAELTEEQVIQWCLDKMPPDQLAMSQTQIAQQISDKEIATQRLLPSAFPWNVTTP